MIERNRHPAGRLYNIGFGLCQVADGLTRVLSLGFLRTRFALTWAKHSARRAFERVKGQA